MIRVTENAINEITPAKEIPPSKLYNDSVNKQGIIWLSLILFTI